MEIEDFQGLLTPTGELILKEKRISVISKGLLEGIAERILHLDLRCNEIRHLENSVLSNLTHLRSLDLRSNKLEVLSDNISQLIHLKILKLDHNLLTVLPIELFKLPLTLLSIRDNSLFTLPSQISEMKYLTMLSIAENQIKELPIELGSLHSLKIFHLHQNDFISLPASFCELEFLEEITLEWFRYITPSTTKIIKGQLGAPILSSLRHLCFKKRQEKGLTLTLLEFLMHFSEANFNINTVDSRQSSLLHLAAASGDIGVVLGLIHSNCDLNLLDVEGFSALGIALKEDHIKIAKILVQAGIELNIGGGSYGNILNLAVIKSEPWLVSYLIKSGLDVNALDSEGSTCLHHLMNAYKKHKHKNALIADMLLEAKIKVNEINKDGWAAVHIAARKGQTAAFRWMHKENLKKNSEISFDVNLSGGKHGWTPLHLASHSGHFKTVQALVSLGAHVYIKNSDGKTPRDISKGDIAIYKFLYRTEKAHIQILLSQPKSLTCNSGVGYPLEDGQDYEELYRSYSNGDFETLQGFLQNKKNEALKSDALYLLSQLRQRKAVKALIGFQEAEDSLVRKEAKSALEGIREIEIRGSHSHNSMGPKLPRSNPLQMSLPVTVSAYIEEETRIDTLLII